LNLTCNSAKAAGFAPESVLEKPSPWYLRSKDLYQELNVLVPVLIYIQELIILKAAGENIHQPLGLKIIRQTTVNKY
jgi:hypothetical protein